VGRTVDLLAYQGVQASGDILLAPSLADPSTGGYVITGIQKLAQRFIVELFREQGTTTFRPGLGTTFLTEARYGSFRTQADVISAFARAVSQIRVNLQAQESDDDPDDERFLDAEVLSVVVESERVAIYANLISRAGRDRQFVFPIAVSNIPNTGEQ
jgi:hypothetical protein